MENTGKRVVAGDISDPATRAKLARVSEGLLMGGISCQPWSVLGDQRALQDERSRSLPGALKMVHLMQVPLTVLECTPFVRDSPDAQALFTRFAAETGMVVHQHVLSLHTFWPSRRQRWWATISHKALGIQPIPDIPPLAFQPSLVHLMPFFMDVSDSELQSLRLDDYEMEQFLTTKKGMHEHQVNNFKALPTATHSWGSQCRGCECGCRKQGFSQQRIEEKGLYGQLIPLPETYVINNSEVPRMRHLHAAEVALANGLNPFYPGLADMSPRLALSAVGQMATPFQSAWVLSNALWNMKHAGYPIDLIDSPLFILKKMAHELFVARDSLLPMSRKSELMLRFEMAIQLWGHKDAVQILSNFTMPDQGLTGTATHATTALPHQGDSLTKVKSNSSHADSTKVNASVLGEMPSAHMPSQPVSVPTNASESSALASEPSPAVSVPPDLSADHVFWKSPTTSRDVSLVTTSPAVTPPMTQAMPLPRLGCGGPFPGDPSVRLTQTQLPNELTKTHNDLHTHANHCPSVFQSPEGDANRASDDTSRPGGSLDCASKPTVCAHTKLGLSNVSLPGQAVQGVHPNTACALQLLGDLNRADSRFGTTAHPAKLQTADPETLFEARMPSPLVSVPSCPSKLNTIVTPSSPTVKTPGVSHSVHEVGNVLTAGSVLSHDDLVTLPMTHAMPLPRLGCGGPSQVDSPLTCEILQTHQAFTTPHEDCSTAEPAQAITCSPSAETNLRPEHAPAEVHESCADQVRALQLQNDAEAYPDFAQQMTSSPTCPPMLPPNAMPLPRLGCGGPSQCDAVMQASLEHNSKRHHHWLTEVDDQPLPPPAPFQCHDQADGVLPSGTQKPDSSTNHHESEALSQQDSDGFTQEMLLVCQQVESQTDSFRREAVPGFQTGIKRSAPVADDCVKRSRQETNQTDPPTVHAMQELSGDIHLTEAPTDKPSQVGDLDHCSPSADGSHDVTGEVHQASSICRVQHQDDQRDTAQQDPGHVTTHVPPTPFHATPLPRLGCGGPSQSDAHEDETKDDTRPLDIPTPEEFADLTVIDEHGNVHDVKVPWGHTAGQLVVAHARLSCQAEADLAINTAMATQIPLSSVLSPGNVVKIDLVQAVTVERTPCQSHLPGELRITPELHQDTRERLLWKQQGWVAHDEMEFYSQMLSNSYPGIIQKPVILEPHDPAMMTQLAIDLIHHVLQANAHVACVPVLLQGHWFPLAAMPCLDKAVLWAPKCQAKQLIEAITTTIGHVPFSICDTVFPHRFPADCGFQTLGWIISMMSMDTEFRAVTDQQASHWRMLFHQHLRASASHTTIVRHPLRVGGANPLEDLTKLVIDHGVAPARGSECADMLISTIGVSSIQKILKSPKPWPDLKARASLCRPPIRIVHPEELQTMIKSKLASEHPIGKKNNKQKSQKPAMANVRITADQILVPHAVFKQQDGVELGQLTPGQINATSKGILVVNYEDAQPYFAVQQALTTEGLGLLVLDHHDQRLPVNHTVVRVPALCKATSEPLIATAALFQLGQKSVQRNLPEECIAVQETPFAVIRVSLYRDQSPVPWDVVTSGPVKHIMSIPSMQGLQQAEVMDVWDRQFLDESLRKVDPSKAALVMVNIRIASSSLEEVLACSGTSGCFVEQRTSDGRSPHPDYQVIWLPKRSFAEATVAQQSNKAPCRLARSGNRYGLRVLRVHAEQTHMAHRPDVIYLQGNDLLRFKVGPVPFGSSKASIATLFRKWGWQARPLAPMGPSRDKSGIMWQVQSTSNPENWIYQATHGDILVTPDTPPQAQPVAKQSFIASDKTIQSLAKSTASASSAPSAEGEDPWLHRDPWKGFTGTTPTLHPQQYAEIESAIDKKLSKHLQPDDRMDVETDRRVEELESKVGQLAQEFSAFQQHQSKQQQVLQHQVAAIDAKVENNHQAINGMLDNKLAQQMARIEQLFAKRAKTCQE
eukprot:s870_g14.t1